jgi:hypothetical protein
MKTLCRGGRSQDLPNTDFYPAIRHLKYKQQYAHYWVASAARTTAITRVAWSFTVVLRDHTLRQVICWGHWSSSWEIADSIVMRKWKQPFISGCKYDSPISTATEFLNSLKVFEKFRKAVKGGKICRRLTCQVRRSLKYKWYILMRSIYRSRVILCTKIVFCIIYKGIWAGLGRKKE